jgi:hypothetical protein
VTKSLSSKDSNRSRVNGYYQITPCSNRGVKFYIVVTELKSLIFSICNFSGMFVRGEQMVLIRQTYMRQYVQCLCTHCSYADEKVVIAESDPILIFHFKTENRKPYEVFFVIPAGLYNGNVSASHSGLTQFHYRPRAWILPSSLASIRNCGLILLSPRSVRNFSSIRNLQFVF